MRTRWCRKTKARSLFWPYRVFKKEPIKNRYISKSSYGWKMTDISCESKLLKCFGSVPLFIVRYELRPWQKLTYHAQKRWCKKAAKVLNSTFGVMNQITRVKGSVLTFMVRSPSFSDSCEQTFKKTLHQTPPSSWSIRQWYKKVRSTGSVEGQKVRKGRAFRTGIQQLINNFRRHIRYPGPLLTC